MTRTANRREHDSDHQDRVGGGRSSLPAAAALIAGVLLAVIAISVVFIWAATGSQSDAEPSPAGTPTVRNSGGETSPPRASQVSMFATTWETKLPYGTHSSPRLIDVDGKPELLISYGDERAGAGGIMAVDAATGEPRWQIETENELFALPIPLTPRESGEHPWVFAGRVAQLYAVDVQSGRTMWQFQRPGSLETFNFYAGRELQDLNGDDIGDYLVAYGGDFTRAPSESRRPGFLMVVSGADGSIIHKMQTPDDRETYCSPLMWPDSGERLVVFGTGGETFPGSLWRVPLDSVAAGSLDDAQRLIPNVVDKGAVAPPSFADVDRDGVLDLICAPFDGRLVVLSGKTFDTLWQFSPRQTIETQCSPAIGDFDGDGDPDIAYVAQRGVFPAWNGTILRVFDGGSGQMLWECQITGQISFASPLAIDIDADGRDEIFIVHGDPAIFNSRAARRSVVSLMQVGHVDERRFETLGGLTGFNAGSGWIGDLDQDGKVEWILTLMHADGSGSLVRVDLGQPAPPRISWGGYLGTRHDGVYSAQ